MDLSDATATRSEAADLLRPIPKSSVSDAIVDQIIDLISKNVLKPGDRLPSERELCRKFGVGRTSVREALRSLAVMGILDGRVGHGTFVADNETYLERALEWGLALDPKRAEDLIETRLMLESNTSFWAAERATHANLTAIELNLSGMEDTIDEPERFLEFDVRFHLEIARAAQNSILFNLLRTTRHYLQEWIKGSLETSSIEPLTSPAAERARLSISQHQAILRALRNRDPAAARRCMQEHILSSSEDLRSHLARKPGSGSEGPASG